jgi:DNA-binding transcriptional LysR family regulator
MTTDYFPEPRPGARVLPDVLSDVSLRHLLSFRAVADEGSFHAAADRLDYTQSAVSQHVAALEAALGVRLFERSRGRRTVTLTEAGTLLLRHAVAISNRLQAARADLLAYAAGETGMLRVGVFQSVGMRVLPAIVTRFAHAWPGVEVRLSEAPDEGLWELVELGTVDLSFGTLPVPPGPFEAVELFSDPYVLVAAAGSPSAGTVANPPLDVIGAMRLIGFKTCGSTRTLEEHLRSQGVEPDFVFRSEDNGTVQAMAGAGLGTALVPLLAADPTDPSVVLIPTDLPPRRVALIRHRDRYRTPAAEAFARIAVDVCAELADELGAQRPVAHPVPPDEG